MREQLRARGHLGQQRHVPHHRREDLEAGGRHQRPLAHVQLWNVYLLRPVCFYGKNLRQNKDREEFLGSENAEKHRER